jgi:hypothetical protein
MRQCKNPCLLIGFLLSQQSSTGLAFSNPNPSNINNNKASPTSAQGSNDETQDILKVESSVPDRRRFFAFTASLVAGGVAMATSPQAAQAIDKNKIGGMLPGGNSNKKIGGLAVKIRGVCNYMVR